MIDYKDFAKTVKLKRLELKISQKDAAKYLAIKQSKYSKIENGIQEPSFIELQFLVELLDIDLEDELKIKRPTVHKPLYD